MNIKNKTIGETPTERKYLKTSGLSFVLQRILLWNNLKTNSNYKIEKRLKQTAHKGKFGNGQPTCECVFNIISHQEKWLKLNRLKTSFFSEKVEQAEPYTWQVATRKIPSLQEKFSNFLPRV